jgi:predicted RND superfamily exporter protein
VLHRFAMRHPFLVLSTSALVTLAAAPGLLRLELRTDGQALVPQSAPAVLADRAIRERFGLEDPVVVLVVSLHPRGIYNPATLRLIAELTLDIERLEGMDRSRISSLATEPGDRHRPGTLGFLGLLEPLPESDEECERLRDDIEALGIYSGTLVSKDGSAAAILAGIPATAARARLLALLEAAVEARRSEGHRLHVIGAPVAESVLGLQILADLGVPAALLGAPLIRQTSSTGGASRSPAELLRLAGRRLGLVPVALALMTAVFLAAFRRPAAALLPLLEVGACLVVVFGLMGSIGVPVYLTITILPVILTAAGVADEIHILRRYRGKLEELPEAPHASAVAAAMDEMRAPVMKTSVTTAFGFLSFALSPLAPVRAFGILAAFGVLFCMLWSLAVTPAVLAVLDPSRLAARRPRRSSRRPWIGALAAAAGRRSTAVIGAAILLAGLSPLGLLRLEVQDSWIGGFPVESEFHRATRLFDEQFHGTHVLAIQVDAGGEALSGELGEEFAGDHRLLLPPELARDPALLVGRKLTVRLLAGEEFRGGEVRPGFWDAWIESAGIEEGRLAVRTPLQSGSPRFLLRLEPGEKVRFEVASGRLSSPAVLEKIEALEAFIAGRSDSAVGGVLGPAVFLKTTSFIARRRDPAARSLPGDPARAAWLWEQYGRTRGPKRLRETLSPEGDKALLTAYLKDANYAGTRRLLEDIRAYEREHLRPHGIELAFAGDVAVSQALIEAIVGTQVRSLLFSLAAIVALSSLLHRSLGWGLLCVVPCGLALLVDFSILGLLGVPLGVATSMFAAMTLGIGVDYAVHFIDRYRRALAGGRGRGAALREAGAIAGPSILLDGVSVALGFGVLSLSQVPANARLGAMAALTILAALAATLVLLPALISRGRGGGEMAEGLESFDA